MRSKPHTTANDNTERKTSDSTLPEPEEWYRTIFSEASDGIALIDYRTGNICDCNPEFEKQTGRKLGQLKEMKVWEIRPPEKAESAREKFLEIQREGAGESTELDLQKPDGEIVPVEFKAKVIEFGGRRYIQSIVRDITEHRNAEMVLAESEEKFRSLAEKSPNMISTTGIKPRMAAPTASPTIEASLMGVVITRVGNSVERPAVTLKAPPYGSKRS